MKKLFVVSLLFLSLPAFGYVTNNITNGCQTYRNSATAVFQINSYTCASGQYLPADAIACVTCPPNATCAGGTFEYNPTHPQGIVINTPVTQNQNGLCSDDYPDMRAVFQINSYNCASGQYLPADALACTSCPNGYTCAGGTFEYNPTTNQGIIANTITINWHGALAADINANDAGTVTYGGDIRTPVRPDPAQIPVGQRFKGWRFSKPTQGE